MRKMCTMLFFVMATIAAVTVSGAAERPRLFLDGVSSYNEGAYHEAVSAFQAIAESGICNEKLFYNLGNACLKEGKIGCAVLWYERAFRLDPHDPDLVFNLDYARSLTRDMKEEKVNPFIGVFFFWKDMLGDAAVRWTAIFLNLCFWGLLTAQAIRRKKTFPFVRHLILGVVLVFLVTACHDYYVTLHVKTAVIIPAEVSVRSGLADDATELFVLHEGTTVSIEKEKSGYSRIYFSRGKIGWIKNDALEVI